MRMVEPSPLMDGPPPPLISVTALGFTQEGAGVAVESLSSGA